MVVGLYGSSVMVRFPIWVRVLVSRSSRHLLGLDFMKVICITYGLWARLVVHGEELAVAVEPGWGGGRAGLAGVAVAAVAARAGLGGHDLGGLEQGAGQPVQLREDHLGVARREVEQ